MGATIQVKVKSVTGRARYYPVGPNVDAVLALIKKKTLSELEIEALKTRSAAPSKKFPVIPTTSIVCKLLPEKVHRFCRSTLSYRYQ